jgi:tetratricopeptide (TPR) repeat protein
VSNPASDPLVGRTVGQYQILARIGGGGMGVVYSARAGRLGRIVALKFLPPQWSHDTSAKDRFVREAQAASATNHPNICTIHDIETADDGQLFIVMAYYEGETLKRRLESGPLPIDEALDIATQVADGLAKAHAQGVVHRDIKPGNLILTEDGVRILDFGLATFADAMKLTAENATLGTMAYMSPEQVRGLPADARADVWATGAVLYEMLTGHPPFRGSHAEAIGYAVRNEQPTLIRDARPEVPEEVEQLVFRALHKEASVRYASGRELARALRQVRGLSVPLDLRTQPLLVPVSLASTINPRPRWRRWATTAVVVVVAVVAGWISWPVAPTSVAVVPVINQTGYPELDAYRLALTEELEAQLERIAGLRVLPHLRLLEIIRASREADRDVSSRDVVQTLATSSAAQLLIVPTLLRDDHGWKVRLEFRDPTTGISYRVHETDGVRSSLEKETVYGLVASLGPIVSEQVTSLGPRRAAFAASVRGVLRGRPRPNTPRMRSLDAARLFEQGLDAYEQLEYSAARAAFASAAMADGANPLPAAWQSRAASLMRQDKEAADAAERASKLLTEGTDADDRLFIEAVAAEARRDRAVAGQRYRAMVQRHPQEASWLIELGGFQDRQGDSSDAVTTYHRALALDGRLLRPHLELCRMYSPSRLNELALARQQGEVALTAAKSQLNRPAEAQALWCLTDVLRSGNEADRQRAHQLADDALRIMEELRHPFGIARGRNYVALVALLADRDGARAARLFESTLEAARGVGYILLEARTLMNLGVSYEMLGNRGGALKAYRASFDLSEALHNSQDAAWNQINAAALLVDYGDPDRGLRDAENALAVVRDLGDKDFEAQARRVIASYYRHAGRYDEASRHLTLGLTVAHERNLDEKIARLTLELARVKFDSGDYRAARQLLLPLRDAAAGANRTQVRLELARTHARLADFEAASAELKAASDAITASEDAGSRPLLNDALGELYYESGRFEDARRAFADASKAWSEDDLPEDASVEARVYLGWLTVLRGDAATGRAALVGSLEHARKRQRILIEARAIVYLARASLRTGDFNSAIARLGELTEAKQQLLNPELQAQIDYWRAEALARRGDVDAGPLRGEARGRLQTWLTNVVGQSYSSNVRLRPDLRLITESATGR